MARTTKVKAEQAVTQDIAAVSAVTAVTELPTQYVQAAVQPKKQFEYKRLSASMLKTFLLCRRKFYLHYIKALPEQANQSFSLGTACHKALETANKSFLIRPRTFSNAEVEGFVQVFRETLAQCHLTESSLFQVGEECVRNELIKYGGSEKILGIESEFDLTTPESVRIYGFMDQLQELDPETLLVVDYKTSKTPMSYEEAMEDEQLAMYDLATSMQFPQYKRRKLQLRYLRTGEYLTVERSEPQLQNFRKEILAVDRAIKYFIAEQAGKSGEVKGQINSLCGWCSHKSCCDEYTRLLSATLPAFPNIDSLTDCQAVELWQQVHAISSAVEKLQDQLKIWVSQRMEAEPEARITDGKKEFGVSSNTRREYDPEVLLKNIDIKDLLGGMTGGEGLLKPVNKNIARYLEAKNDPLLTNLIENSATVKFNSPSFRLRKVK